MQRLGTSIPAALALTVLLSVVVAGIVGAICVRLKEIYFAFVTLAFQKLLHSLIIAWTPLTGGDQGLTGGVPRPPFLGIRLDQPYHLYLFSAGLLVLCLLLMRHIVQSPFGYTLRLIRDNPARATSLGINVWAIRLAAFIIAGAFASIGGVVMNLFVSGAFPDFAYWTISGEAIFMIMLGGTTLFLGPVAGAVMLLVLSDVVTKLTEHHGLVLGLIILLFALGLRKGLADYLAELWHQRSAAPGSGPLPAAPFAEPSNKLSGE